MLVVERVQILEDAHRHSSFIDSDHGLEAEQEREGRTYDFTPVLRKVADCRNHISQMGSSPVEASVLWAEWLAAFNNAALQLVGRKRVCTGSNSLFDGQMKFFF